MHDIEPVPATAALLDAAIVDPARLAALLHAEVADGWNSFPEALPVMRGQAAAAGYGPWPHMLLLLRAPRTLVGLGGFKGAPDADGVVEIGYEIAPAFRGRGLAEQAARAMLRQAFADPAIAAVRAHTLAHENASTRLLARLGFAHVGGFDDPDDGSVWEWRLDRAA